jgi:D-alanyl-D-alanine carboxypeptidase
MNMKKVKLIIVLLLAYCSNLYAQKNADSLLNFIVTHKAQAALYLTSNDTVLAKLNEDKQMPLASTVKILVAIEFSRQAARHDIDENTIVALKDLDKFYLENTDGNAHPDWLAYEKSLGHIVNDSIILLNVARGMIQFSSNANTEYLMDLLGLDNIQKVATTLKVEKHSKVYPIVSSLFMYQNPKKMQEDKVLKGINKLTEEQYCRYIYDIHKALNNDTLLKPKFRPQDLSMKMQRMWSAKLTSSTTKEYAKICNALNNRAYYDEETYAILSLVLETLMENPANKKWLKHAGAKGGSTAWVLTKATYATTLENKRIELAYFFNNLNPADNERLQGWMNEFELNLIAKASFRKKVADALK